MKALSFLILFLFTLRSSAQCDSTFFRNTATLIYDMHVFDTNRILGVGDNGYVIKSDNGGKSWRNIPTFQQHFLRAVYPASDSVFYAVGSNKTVLKSEDAGDTWFPLYVKTNNFTSAAAFLNDLYFFNKDQGFIVGDDALLYTTTDGGRSWRDTSFSTVGSSRLNCITFVNDTLGFISGGGSTLFRTRNGGRSWEQINVDFIGFNQDIKKVRFLDHLTGFAVGGNGLFMKTTDGGSTWTKHSTPASGIYYDLCIVDAKTVLVGGTYDSGIILKTTDAGTTWTVTYDSFSYPSSCYTVAADPARKKIFFGGGGSPGDFLGYNGRSLAATSDTGATYQRLSGNSGTDYRDAFFLNDSTGFIAGQAGLAYKTIDYGETWKPLARIPALFASNDARSIFFVNDTLGYAASDRIYKTRNGGATWTQTTIPGQDAQYAAKRMFFYDSLEGLVMDNYSIYRTTNGGTTWSQVLAFPLVLRDFCTTPDGKAFAVGLDGAFFTSANKGLTWTPFNLNTKDYLTSVYFYNASTGFIGTADTTIYKTVNGGATWTKISNRSVGVAEGRSFLFLDDSTGYQIRGHSGGVGTLLRTKNGGLTWQPVKQQTEDLARLAGFKTVYVAGGRGFLYKSEKARVPTTPGYIYGPEVNCQNTTSLFRTGEMSGVNFLWTLGSGGTQSPRQNLDTVRWAAPGLHLLSVAAFNVCGTSPVRQVTIAVSPVTAITSPPQAQTVCTGAPATLTVAATGDSLTYLWMKNGIAIAGATGATLTIPATAALDSGNYAVEVNGLCGRVTSTTVKLTVLGAGSCTTSISTPPGWMETFVLMPNVVASHAVVKIASARHSTVLFSVIDGNGRTVQRFTRQVKRGETVFDLHVAGLPAGLYQLIAVTPNMPVQNVRFIKR